VSNDTTRCSLATALVPHPATLRGHGFDDIDVLDRVLRYETPHLGLWLDTSDQHPEQTATELAERGLQDGLID
jgi:hypothetical protein